MEGQRLNNCMYQLIGSRWYAVQLLPSTQGAASTCNQALRQELCPLRERRGTAGITPLLYHRAACPQHVPPKWCSLSLKAFGNSQGSKTYMYT